VAGESFGCVVGFDRARNTGAGLLVRIGKLRELMWLENRDSLTDSALLPGW